MSNETEISTAEEDMSDMHEVLKESESSFNYDMCTTETESLSISENPILEVMPEMLHNDSTVNNLSCETAETNNIVPSDNESKNVPTLGIIVMPMSLNLCRDQSDESCDGSFEVGTDEPVDYQVLFSDSSSVYPIDLLTGSETILSQEDCDKDRGITLLSGEQDVAVFAAPVDVQFL